MQRVDVTRPNNLNLLHEELIAGVPTFHRTVVDSDGEHMAPDGGRVSGLGDHILIDFADDIDPSDVLGVVNAHDHTQRSAAQTVQAQIARDRLDFETGVIAVGAGAIRSAFDDLVDYLQARLP